MALAATSVWEVRTTGSDSNGGGFNPSRGGGGSDLSQQDAAQQSWDGATNALSAAQNSTTLSSNTGLFTSAMVGNTVQITGGANFVAGWYEITAFTNATTVTLDRAPATAGAGSAGAGAVGGALASPGKAGAAHVAGNVVYVKSGTYPVTSATANVAGGCVSLTAGAVANQTMIVGYGTSRGDGGTKPLLQASGIATFTVVTLAADTRAENLSVDGASLTSSRAFNFSNTAGAAYRCKAANCSNGGFAGGAAGECGLCEATGCSSVVAITVGFAWGCTAHDNTTVGFTVASNSFGVVDCASVNNTGAGSHGFNVSSNNTLINCLAYGNGGSGFSFINTSTRQTAVNCVAVNNLAFGYTVPATTGSIWLYNCAGQNNTSGNVGPNIPAATQVGFIALSGSPFTSAAGNDFSLNNTAGAGASLRAAGIPGSTAALQLPGLSTLSYPDVGAAQHPDPVRGSTGYYGG